MSLTKSIFDQANLRGIVPLKQLLDRYQTATSFLEEHLSILGIEPQDVDGELFITLPQVHQLDLFYERLKLGWALSLLQRLDNDFKGV